MEAKEKHIVLLSGGKDSTAMALRLAEVEPREYEYLCTPTGNELPEMVEHWKKIGDLLGKEIKHIGNRTLAGIILENKMIPNWRARFCTRQLKIEPFKAWLLSNMPAVGYIGLRADEGEREGVTYTEEQIKTELTQRYPLTEWGWSLKDVVEYLDKRGVTIPRRTDCALCFFQRLPEWWRLWKDHPDELEKGILIEETMGHTFRSPGRDTWPAEISKLKERFERGYVPRGALTQGDMFSERDPIAESKCRMCTI